MQQPTRALVPVSASSQPITDEEFLEFVRHPAKNARIEEFVLSQHSPTNLIVAPKWFRRRLDHLCCYNGRGHNFPYRRLDYVTEGNGHAALLVCTSGESGCAVVPAIGLLGEASPSLYLRARSAIRFWRRVYEYMFRCPTCNSMKLGKTQITAVEENIAYLRHLCHGKGCPNRVIRNPLFFFYQHPLYQGAPPSKDEVLNTHERLRGYKLSETDFV